MSKLPFVSSDIPRDLRQFINSVRETIGGAGDARLITVGDLVRGGIVTIGGGGVITPPTGTVDPPTTPTNVAASGAIQNIIVTWDAPLYRGHAYAEIWGSATDNVGVAVKIGMSPGAIFVDSVGPSIVRYYWVRFVNILGAIGAFNAVAGTRAETGADVDYLLSKLTGQITESQLYATLNTRIDGIATNAAAIATEASTRATETGNLYAQYTVKVDVAGHVSGFGLASTLVNGVPFSAFGIRADQFWIAPPSFVSATAPTTNLYNGYVWVDSSVTPNVTRYRNTTTNSWVTTAPNLPFIVQATPTTINGVAVAAGVYMDTAFIRNGTITNVKIADATIDNAKIVSLSAAKITAGAIAVDQYIQSTVYTQNSAGWKIHANGTAEFAAASIRGKLTADQINGNGLTINDINGHPILTAGNTVANSTFAGNVTGNIDGTLASTVASNASTAITGLANKLDLSGSQILTGPVSLNAVNAITVGTPNLNNASGANGFYIGNTGIVGTKNGRATFTLNNAGDATFAGTLSAATGSFAGSMAATTISTNSGKFSVNDAGILTAIEADIQRRPVLATGVFTPSRTINGYTTDGEGNIVTYSTGTPLSVGLFPLIDTGITDNYLIDTSASQQFGVSLHGEGAGSYTGGNGSFYVSAKALCVVNRTYSVGGVLTSNDLKVYISIIDVTIATVSDIFSTFALPSFRWKVYKL